MPPRTFFAACLLVIAAARLVVAAPNDEPKPPKPGWANQNPPDLVRLDAGRRNPFFYVGETVSFTATGPAADRWEVRDYWGEIVDKGPFAATITLKPQPPGWYELYVFGMPVIEPKTDPRTPAEQELDGDVTPQAKAKAAAQQAAWQYRQWYGDGVGGTTFVVARDDPNFPKLPPRGKYPSPGTGDEVMRAVSGMGPQRHSADASKPDESIRRLEAEIATDKELYLPGDPKRRRALFIAFGNGTKGHLDGVRKIVEHFKDTVQYYEPRNEPNGGSTGGDFVKNEMADFYKVVKGVDPSLKVIGPGTVSIGPNNSGLGFIEDYLKAGGAELIDGFSFHFYNALNGDLAMGRRSMDALMALLRKYNADKKELWQTEQGHFAAMYGAYQPRHQGRWTMLEMMLFEQYGLPKEHNHLWYDVSQGVLGFPDVVGERRRRLQPRPPADARLRRRGLRHQLLKGLRPRARRQSPLPRQPVRGGQEASRRLHQLRRDRGQGRPDREGRRRKTPRRLRVRRRVRPPRHRRPGHAHRPRVTRVG
jgi:hypothetical protein